MTIDTTIFAQPETIGTQVLLGIPMPQAIPFAPAWATPEQAATLYQEVLQRFAAYGRSAGMALPVPSIVAAALWSDDRLRWISARLASGSASQGEFDLAAKILEAANEIFGIFARWLTVGGGDPGLLYDLQITFSNLAAQIAPAADAAPAAPVANGFSATVKNAASMPATPLSREEGEGSGIFGLVLVGLGAFVLFADIFSLKSAQRAKG